MHENKILTQMKLKMFVQVWIVLNLFEFIRNSMTLASICNLKHLYWNMFLWNPHEICFTFQSLILNSLIHFCVLVTIVFYVDDEKYDYVYNHVIVNKWQKCVYLLP